MIGDATDNDGADGPKHLQHLCRGSSQSQWHYLAAVGGCICNEDAPRNALEKLGQQQHSQRVTEIEDEDEGVQGHQTANSRPSVSNPAGDGTSQEDADECTDGSTALKC